MNYVEAMEYITNTAKFGSNYGLERTEKILELLGNPHKKLKCIHIAGTNGKGSTTAMISKILIEEGYKVGMYTSPFLEEFEERIQVDGKNISKEHLSEMVSEVAEAVNKVIALGYDHPTEFEIITCTMFLYFYIQKVDFAVVEVGLGGRLDSTNVIVPVVSVITSISFDHMNILGDSLEQIASEKAGIIKEGVPVVLFPQEKESFKVIEKVCHEKNSKLIKVLADSAQYLQTVGCKQSISLNTKNEEYDILLSLLGKHQLLNCAVAVNTIEELNRQGVYIRKESIISALSNVEWHGRLEVMNNKPLVVIDGAHNIDGIKKLRDSVETHFKYEKMVLILGILADKQVEEMIEIIAPLADRIVAVTPNSERAQLAEELKNVIDKYDVRCEAVEDYKEAYLRAFNYCGNDDLLLISGSLYMIGDMRKIIREGIFK